MEPTNNIVYQIQYSTLSFILDLQANIYNKITKPYHMSGRYGVRSEDLSIDVFLEAQNRRYDHVLYLIDDIALGRHLWYEI